MKRILTLCTSATLLMTSQLATAEDYEAEHLIEYRQESMDAIKHHNNAIKLILQGKVPYDAALTSHMKAMGDLFDDIGNWFPEGSDFGETNAKDGIWDSPDKFAKSVKDSQSAFADFKAVVDKGDNKASAKAQKKFGKASCGSCHKKFKKKDD